MIVSVKNVVTMYMYCNYVSLSMWVAIFVAEDARTYMQYWHHSDKIHAQNSDKIHALLTVPIKHVCCMYVACMCMYVACMSALCVRSVEYNTTIMTICHWLFGLLVYVQYVQEAWCTTLWQWLSVSNSLHLFFVCEQHVHELFKLALAPWKQTPRRHISMSLEGILGDTRSQKDRTQFYFKFFFFQLATAK